MYHGRRADEEDRAAGKIRGCAFGRLQGELGGVRHSRSPLLAIRTEANPARRTPRAIRRAPSSTAGATASNPPTAQVISRLEQDLYRAVLLFLEDLVAVRRFLER